MTGLNIFLAAAALTIASIPAIAQNDWQSRKDRENAATSAGSITRNGGRWDSAAQADRARARAQQSGPRFSAHLTNCGGGFCHDEYGNSYSVSGQTLIRQDGMACSYSGNLVDCR
jgi:cytochrome c553